LEMTETVFMRDDAKAVVVFHDLHDIGVRLALDDFGTGYSSLSYLLRFPVDCVKIDKTFVAGLGQDPASKTLVSAVIGLAHGLGMSVVAEGVESLQQHRELSSLGCDSCQGFYYSRPMPVGRFEDLLQSQDVRGDPSLPTRERASVQSSTR
jgi:EAL domain-containing protein (putative c-di-GMP-specific phosphodiesterase class I)